MCGDGVSAIQFLEGKCYCNIDALSDQCHNISDDLFNACKYAGLYNHILMSVLRINVPCGPWLQDMRWKEALQALNEVFETPTPEAVPYYQSLLQEMLDD